MIKLMTQIVDDLKSAMQIEINIKKNDSLHPVTKINYLQHAQDHKWTCRTIISRLPEINKKKDTVEYNELVTLIRKIIKEEKVRLIFERKMLKESDVKGKTAKELDKLLNEIIEKDEIESDRIILLEGYLPDVATEEEIEKWINENIDFSSLKSPQQSIGITMKYFAPLADGKVVKNIIERMGK